MKISFFKIVFALVFGIFSFSLLLASPVYAGTEHNMSGWAWSSNIGWISFNCTNISDDVCNSSNYGVNKNDNGTLVGYAWSSNIGWIQFGGLDTNSMPSGSGTKSIDAKVNDGKLEGWAKALSADGNGWDGWISLAGTNYSVTLSGTDFTSFAWGSDVVGWIDFAWVKINVASSQLSFSADSSIAYAPDYKATLRWDVTPAGESLINCTADSSSPLNANTVSSWYGLVDGIPPQRSKIVDVPYNSTKYKLTCVDKATGDLLTSTIFVARDALPMESVTLWNSTDVSNGRVTLSWTTNNVNDDCVASSVPSGLWSEAKEKNGSETNVSVPAIHPDSDTYTLTCTGASSNNPISASLNLNDESKAIRRIPGFHNN